MENIKIDDFTKYKFLSDLNFSSRGDKACFVVHESDLEDNKYKSNLWLYNKADNKHFQLTSFNNESNYIWLNDSESILFSAVRDDKDKESLKQGEEFTQFYKINVNGGEAVKAFRIPKNVSSIKQIDENTFVFTAIYSIGKKDLSALSDTEKAEELKVRKEEKDYEVLDEIPFWGNGIGFINKKRNRLYIYDAKSNKCEAITKEYTNVDDFHLNELKDKLVFTAYTFKDKMPISNGVYIYDIKSKKLQCISHEETFGYGYVNFMDEDTIICTGSAMKDYGINEDAKFYTIDINTKERKLLTPDFNKSTWNSVGSDCRYGGGNGIVKDGKYLYFITTEFHSSYINRMDEKGHIEKVTKEKGSVDTFTVNNGEMLLVALREQKLQEIYKLEKGQELQLTHFNEWVQKERKVVTPEKLLVETAPGVEIEGWVIKPADFDENKKYPAILDIHGGPKTVYGEVYYHEMQYWANEGYFVFFCNPRGSDGRGNEFADIRGKYGTIDYDDIMRFTDEVLNKYKNIDSERVGVTGGSYGGFMTNWIIGHTDRFKAAAAQRSISNWISKFGTTDIGYYFVDDQNAATPWVDVEKLWNHSPLKYADKVKTPTLFIHSEEDYRCWLAEGLQMFSALKYHGVEARLCMFKGENHELSRSGKPKHRIRRIKEITSWFDSHLK